MGQGSSGRWGAHGANQAPSKGRQTICHGGRGPRRVLWRGAGGAQSCRDLNESPRGADSGLRPHARPSPAISDADGAEDGEAGQRGADQDPSALRVPVQLLEVRLALVHEQQLLREARQPGLGLHVARLEVPLHSQVPLCDLVICTRGCEDPTVLGVPLDGGHGGHVLLEGGHRGAGLWEDGSQALSTSA